MQFIATIHIDCAVHLNYALPFAINKEGRPLGRPSDLSYGIGWHGGDAIIASLPANQFIHLTTVTRCVLMPFSVAMRTMYTPALN